MLKVPYNQGLFSVHFLFSFSMQNAIDVYLFYSEEALFEAAKKSIELYFNKIHHPVAWDYFENLKTFILSGTRTQTLELHISHTTWTQTHHLDTTCCSYLSDKILFIIYSSPCVMRFVSKVLNFYSVRQMYDKI